MRLRRSLFAAAMMLGMLASGFDSFEGFEEVQDERPGRTRSSRKKQARASVEVVVREMIPSDFPQLMRDAMAWNDARMQKHVLSGRGSRRTGTGARTTPARLGFSRASESSGALEGRGMTLDNLQRIYSYHSNRVPPLRSNASASARRTASAAGSRARDAAAAADSKPEEYRVWIMEARRKNRSSSGEEEGEDENKNSGMADILAQDCVRFMPYSTASSVGDSQILAHVVLKHQDIQDSVALRSLWIIRWAHVSQPFKEYNPLGVLIDSIRRRARENLATVYTSWYLHSKANLLSDSLPRGRHWSTRQKRKENRYGCDYDDSSYNPYTNPGPLPDSADMLGNWDSWFEALGAVRKREVIAEKNEGIEGEETEAEGMGVVGEVRHSLEASSRSFDDVSWRISPFVVQKVLSRPLSFAFGLEKLAKNGYSRLKDIVHQPELQPQPDASNSEHDDDDDDDAL
mmetsp:Transcript_6253/g.11552  ORF Transcript_6253/g.11552 Transcript_6253/m.11552 type:complete len:459 (+) Transcript_6253:124-1500(+)